jgi:hypothetical protein
MFPSPGEKVEKHLFRSPLQFQSLNNQLHALNIRFCQLVKIRTFTKLHCGNTHEMMADVKNQNNSETYPAAGYTTLVGFSVCVASKHVIKQKAKI